MNVKKGVKGFMSRSPEERFWEKVDKTDYCWNWTGSTNGRGYGGFFYENKLQKAHRVSFKFAYGEIKEGMHVCHKCDNPRCVNPSHLFEGTPKDNAVDRVKKGRNWNVTKPESVAKGERSTMRRHPELAMRGELHVKHKLTADDVRNLRARKGEKKERDFAIEFGVSHSLIHQVLSGKVWKHI